MTGTKKKAVNSTGEYTFCEKDIYDEKKYIQMKELVLVDFDERDTVVTPVRRKNSPHFRRIGTGWETRLDRAESDPTHNKCVGMLFEKLQGKPTKIYTYQFDENLRNRQVIAELKGAPDYKWWKETRVSVGRSTYIQPDLMGRDNSVFMSNVASRGVVIEVIQTHIPNRDTFFSLLRISALGFLVVFYFIPPGEMNSKYNQFHIQGNEAQLYITYYLLDGVVWANGEPRSQYNYTDEKWYEKLKDNYFSTPMTEKNKAK